MCSGTGAQTWRACTLEFIANAPVTTLSLRSVAGGARPDVPNASRARPYTGRVNPSAGQSGSGGAFAPPGALRVVQAACADALALDLAAQFDAVRPGPFDRCVVAVQGPGMGRWLRSFMAQRAGAWGGVETPFLRGLLLGLAAAAGGGAAPRGREDLAALRFRVASALDAALRDPTHPSHAALRSMLMDAGGIADQARLLSLSLGLAEAFDRYEVDRPELVDAWHGGKAFRNPKWSERLVSIEAWQRPLWNAAARDWPTRQVWSSLRLLVESLERGVVPAAVQLPAFLSVFGVSSLPPFLVRSLQALARRVPVTLHLLSPSASFLAERVDRRRLLWDAAERGLDEATLRAAHAMPAGHPLLDAMGRQAVEAQRVLLDAGLDLQQAEPQHQGEGTLLGAVQRGLLLDEPPVPQAVDAKDRSIRVHAVATPRRAAEVVHDAVLDAFATLPDLRPEQVAILTPDLAGVGRAIESVFAEFGVLPLTAGDAGLACPSSLVVTLQQAFTAAMDGLPIDAVLEVLGQPCVQAALGLDEGDGPGCLQRLREAGARRFADAGQRAQVLGRAATPDDALHTLQWAVDRVVLGTAMGEPPRDRAARVDSSDALQESSIEVLAASSAGSAGLAALHRVTQAAERLAMFAHALRGDRTVEAWCAEVRGLADALLPATDHADFGEERLRVDQALQALADASRAGSFQLPVEGAVARTLVLDAVADVREGTRFASGGITLARLSPMRSIPFRVLVLAGLEPGTFPRRAAAAAFDLAAADPRAGDRSPRLEDQQLFLECVHAARDRLVLVHQGVEPRSGDARPASPVVDQLLEACAAHLGASADETRQRLVRAHPLRADQPEAWEKPGETGFDARARRGAQASAIGRTSPRVTPFVGDAGIPLQPPASMAAWLRMLRNPGDAFIERLGIRVPDLDRRVAEGDELLELDHLQKWLLKDGCLRALLRGTSTQSWERWARMEGLLPHGARGRRVAAHVAAAAMEAHQAVAGVVAEHGLASADWRTEAHDARLVVNGMAYAVSAERVQGTSACVVVGSRPSRAESYRRWIDHLMWSAAVPGGPFLLVTGTGSASLRSPIDPAVALGRLVRLHDIATAGSSHPLPIDPEVIGKWKPDPDARAQSVETVLHGGFQGRPGLMQEPVTALAHRDETWDGQGPTVRVHPDRKHVRVSLDALAAEIVDAMVQDGWLKAGKDA